MAVKFTKRDNLSKIFEEFPKLPDLKQVTFPDDKEKKPKQKRKTRWLLFNNSHLVCFRLELFFSPSVSLDSQTVSAKEYLFPYQKKRIKPFRQVKGRQANIWNQIPVLIVNWNKIWRNRVGNSNQFLTVFYSRFNPLYILKSMGTKTKKQALRKLGKP